MECGNGNYRYRKTKIIKLIKPCKFSWISGDQVAEAEVSTYSDSPKAATRIKNYERKSNCRDTSYDCTSAEYDILLHRKSRSQNII
jgi:hypothetical protein